MTYGAIALGAALTSLLKLGITLVEDLLLSASKHICGCDVTQRAPFLMSVMHRLADLHE